MSDYPLPADELCREHRASVCEECAVAAACEDRDSDIASLRATIERLTAERDEALAANAAAVCAWQEYGRWPEMYGVVPIGRYRGPDGVEQEIALRADQITGITRGIMRHVESLLPTGLHAVQAMQREASVIARAESAEATIARLAKVVRAALAYYATMQVGAGHATGCPLIERNEPCTCGDAEDAALDASFRSLTAEDRRRAGIESKEGRA